MPCYNNKRAISLENRTSFPAVWCFSCWLLLLPHHIPAAIRPLEPEMWYPPSTSVCRANVVAWPLLLLRTESIPFEFLISSENSILPPLLFLPVTRLFVGVCACFNSPENRQ